MDGETEQALYLTGTRIDCLRKPSAEITPMI